MCARGDDARAWDARAKAFRPITQRRTPSTLPKVLAVGAGLGTLPAGERANYAFLDEVNRIERI